MSEHFEGLEQAVRESATLEQRIAECRIRISRMCSEKRPPRMSIPVRWNDDDTFIVATLKDCDGLRAEVAKSAEAVGLLMDECDRLKAELAKHTEPLTEEQAQALYEAGDWPISARGWNTIDAAIRRVRRGE